MTPDSFGDATANQRPGEAVQAATECGRRPIVLLEVRRGSGGDLRWRGGLVQAVGSCSGRTASKKKAGGGGARNPTNDPKLKINGLGSKNEA